MVGTVTLRPQYRWPWLCQVRGHTGSLIHSVFTPTPSSTDADAETLLIKFEIERRCCSQSPTNFRFFSCGCKINLQVVILFLMCLVRNLQKKLKKCPKSIQLGLCIRYCTDRLTLRRFLEVKLKHLDSYNRSSQLIPTFKKQF